MKTIYNLKSVMWNGVHIMQEIDDIFLTKELAEKALAKLNELDEKDDKNKFKLPITRSISELTLFETESDVKILNYDGDE